MDLQSRGWNKSQVNLPFSQRDYLFFSFYKCLGCIVVVVVVILSLHRVQALANLNGDDVLDVAVRMTGAINGTNSTWVRSFLLFVRSFVRSFVRAFPPPFLH